MDRNSPIYKDLPHTKGLLFAELRNGEVHADEVKVCIAPLRSSRAAGDGIPPQTLERSTIVGSAIGVGGHNRAHGIERSGRHTQRGLRASGPATAKAAHSDR